MAELAAVDKALILAIAIGHAVNLLKEPVAVARRAPGRVFHARRLDRLTYAFRRGRMGCEEIHPVRVVGPAGDARLQLRLRLQRGEEIRLRGGVVTRAGEVAHAELVALELLIAGIGGDDALADRIAKLVDRLHRLRRGAKHRSADRSRKNADLRNPGCLLTAGGMRRSHMANLMPNDSGQFRFRVRQSDQTARDIDIAAGQREGVDHRTVQHGERPFGFRLLRFRCKPPPDPFDIFPKRAVFHLAAELSHNLGMVFVTDALVRG